MTTYLPKFSRRDGESILETEQFIARPIAEVFEFFSRAENLEAITPEFVGFHVTGMSTPEIQEGTLIDYRLKIHGIPIRWRTRIEEWRPGERFVDTQLVGPYALWHHTHMFESVPGGTLMRDRVRFREPLGWLGHLVSGWLVRRDVEQIFRYRFEAVARRFAAAV